MDRFEECDEGGERLQAFNKSIWDRLVPRSGPCRSLQGELVRASLRLQSEYYRNGLGNYYVREKPEEGLADNPYGGGVLLVIDTLVANRGGSLHERDVTYLTKMREAVVRDWELKIRLGDLEEKSVDGGGTGLTEQEAQELEQLEQLEESDAVDWEKYFARAERCIANWCLANPALVDLQGKPIREGELSDLRHIFEPPPPCPKCNGKGWLVSADRSQFPTPCECAGAPLRPESR